MGLRALRRGRADGRLGHLAAGGPFEEFFARRDDAIISLAPKGTPDPSSSIGELDFVSGGAITQAVLYALARIPGARGQARVIEPDFHDVTNLNRYALLTTDGVGSSKAEHLAGIDLGGLSVESVPHQFTAAAADEVGPLRRHVLVGVDNLPSRWAVQDANPAWIGIGATEEHLALATYHVPGLPCARCVHDGEPQPDEREIATVAFVSHWAGLALAAVYVRHLLGSLESSEQVHQLHCLQLGSPHALWITPGAARGPCGCNQSVA